VRRATEIPEEWLMRPEERTRKPRTFTAAELMAEELPEVPWVVPDVLPEGVTFLAGKPKLGKSWMVMELSLAVATGGVALGIKSVERGEVLHLALEDNRRRLQKRLGLLLTNGTAPEGMHLNLDWPRAGDGGVEALDAWLSDHPGCRLVVIDTLARFKPRTTGRRTQYDEDRDAVDPLGPVAAEHGVSILLVHHLRETESEDPLDMITGSVGLTGGVDGALVLKRRRGQADAFLHVDGRDIENPTELALKFDPDAATWAIVGDAEEYRLSEGRQAIRRVLANTDEPLSPKEIAEITGAKYGATREMLSQMVKDGQVKNLGRGAYTLPANLQNSADNADILTKQETNVSLSGSSGQFRKESDASLVTCIHNFPGGVGCYLCDPDHPERKRQRGEQ
jgi:hypothetical protein